MDKGVYKDFCVCMSDPRHAICKQIPQFIKPQSLRTALGEQVSAVSIKIPTEALYIPSAKQSNLQNVT